MTQSSAETLSRLEQRIVRYRQLRPCFNAFIDTRTPGSDRKENFTIIGPGVAENPAQHVHIREPHGFNIGGARQPPGCTNSQHSHDTAEVFYVHSGYWRFDLGEHGDDAQVELQPGDLISLPTKMFRGFTNIGSETGFLWAVLGGDDPGRVLWAPKVFELAKAYGLVLLEDGSLVDTLAGETVPPNKRPMAATSRSQVDALQRLSAEDIAPCIARAGSAGPCGVFSGEDGVTDTLLIGGGRIAMPHGFTVSEVRLAPGAAIAPHALAVPDVWFIQSGEIRVTVDSETALLRPGDTFTCPQHAIRSFRQHGSNEAIAVAVRGGDEPPAIRWI